MKIRDLLVSVLVDINPNVYENYVAHEGIQKLKESTRQYTEYYRSLLFYKKFKKKLESIRFNLNPYDPCVAT